MKIKKNKSKNKIFKFKKNMVCRKKEYKLQIKKWAFMDIAKFCSKPNFHPGPLFVVLFALTAIFAHSSNQQTSPNFGTGASEYETIDWIDLIPKEDLDVLLNPPSYITDIQDGSIEDEIGSQLKTDPVSVQNDRYQQALVSQNIKPGMDKRLSLIHI